MSLADRLQPFGALKGENGKAPHLRGFSLVGVPGLSRLRDRAYGAGVRLASRPRADPPGSTVTRSQIRAIPGGRSRPRRTVSISGDEWAAVTTLKSSN